MSISIQPQSDTDGVAGRPTAGTALPVQPSLSKPFGARIRSRLFTKYVALFVAVVAIALLSNGIFEVFFYYREHKAALIRIQHEQAEAAAAKIGQFIKEIENQLGWTTQLPWSAGSIEQRRFDALRLLRQVPAITELAQVDSTGKERLRVSRLAMDVVDSGLDLSQDPKFSEAAAHKVFYGPVYFRRDSEPYMTLSLAGTRKDAGVSIAEVNLKLIWDVVSQIKVGEHGHAYVVGPAGRLIAHPDISLVLRNTDMSKLPQVQAAQAGGSDADSESLQGAKNIQGQEVLTASAPIAPLGWTMFVELPVEEAYASLYAALQRLALVLAAASLFAVLAGIFLARRMVGPIQALRAGAERIGGGNFGQRISITTGDELEGLADQFNEMGARLQESYADLEHKVEQRTSELKQSLEQQTATAEVLKVISRSAFDLQSVLKTLLASAAKLCEAEKGVIFLRKKNSYRLASNHGFSPEFETFAKANPFPMDITSTMTRAAQSGGIVQVVDVLEDETRSALAREYQRLGGYRTNLGIPLRRGGETIGVFTLTRQEVRAFTPRQIELLQTFADQAVIAIENARLFNETKEALERQTATSDILNVIAASPTDTRPVFEAIASRAKSLVAGFSSTVFRFIDGQTHLEAFTPTTPEADKILISTFPRPVADFAPFRMAQSGEVTQVPDVEVLTDEIKDIGRARGFRSMLFAPLMNKGVSIGFIVVTRVEAGSFAEHHVQLLRTFADQAMIAIGNTELFNEVQQRTRELSKSLDDLRTAQDRLVQTEKLASLGQLTAGIAHEIKNPLNFVNNFSALSAELLDELSEVLESKILDGKVREEIDEIAQMLKGNLQKVVQHGKRADSIVKNMLLHSREGSGEIRPADINAIVEESLNLAYHGARAENS
ncbi:MAG: GAF domain-containing protein, partial [Hyphomicrobiales bacterium]|nr:GAF domain-containing protein [Hyphomicrobiales bacterium]